MFYPLAMLYYLKSKVTLFFLVGYVRFLTGYREFKQQGAEMSSNDGEQLSYAN